MKTLFALLTFICPILSLAGGPVFGGNLPAIRPKHVREDSPQFDLALSYLKPGDVARVQTLAWEILWDPAGPYELRGVDTAIKKMAEKRVKPLWLLQPCPFPTSPWYQSGWKDWWMPSRELWPKIVKMNTTIVQHIISETAKVSTEKPLFQLWNEPEAGKPGGSANTKFGEWAPELHELLFALVTDLRAKEVPKEQIIGPAISSFGEGRRSETAEFLSMMPPSEFDWLSECGYRACHVRLSANWAKGNLAEIKRGFQASLDWVNWVNSKFKWPADQQVILTEFYVTPGDCGVPVGSDMFPFHQIAFDLLKASSFSHVVGWGLRPDEKDSATDPWARFGGLGDSLVKWREGAQHGSHAERQSEEIFRRR
jgi:hypothetical protein